jgi:hypothetical protein
MRPNSPSTRCRTRTIDQERGTGVRRKLVCALGYRGNDVNLMATPRRGTGQRTEDDNNWLTTVASLAVGTAFFALWFWLLPSWLGFRIDTAGAARWRWIAALPSVLGFAVASAAYGTSGARDTAPPHL